MAWLGDWNGDGYDDFAVGEAHHDRAAGEKEDDHVGYVGDIGDLGVDAVAIGGIDVDGEEADMGAAYFVLQCGL